MKERVVSNINIHDSDDYLFQRIPKSSSVSPRRLSLFGLDIVPGNDERQLDVVKHSLVTQTPFKLSQIAINGVSELNVSSDDPTCDEPLHVYLYNISLKRSPPPDQFLDNNNYRIELYGLSDLLERNDVAKTTRAILEQVI